MYYLETRVGDEVSYWKLARSSVVVGRGDGSDVLVPHESLSRKHLRIDTAADGGIRIEDLGSTNGVRIQGRLVSEATVEVGRWFLGGSVLMRVRRGVDAGGEPARRTTPPSAIIGGTTHGRAADATAAGHPPEASSRLLDVVGEAVEAGLSDVEVAATIVDALVRSRPIDGVLLVERRGDAWTVAARAGAEPPDDDRVRGILTERGTPDDAAALNGDLFAVPIRRGQAELGVLAFVPPSAELASDSMVRTAATLCAMVLGGGHGADHAVTRAGARARADADGAGRGFEATLVPPFVTVSPACREMLVEVDRLALTDLPILIHGETGTGKELLAERIHAVSPRRRARFIGINCAALPSELLEAELFGIERGVATGVDPRPGQFQLASGGTLLLDEIGDMPADLQPKLLRALESGRVHPVGSADPVTTDVRIVASSHQPLEEKVERGEFRRDLYHRICGALVDVPPLRERPDDVLPLARVFLREACAKQKRRCEGVDLDAARALAGYRWPGNVRELRAVVFRAVALSRGSVIQAEDLPRALRGETDGVRADAVLGLDEDLRTARKHFERMYFARLIERCDGNLSKAAAEAGLARWSLYKKLEALGLRGRAHEPAEGE